MKGYAIYGVNTPEKYNEIMRIVGEEPDATEDNFVEMYLYQELPDDLDLPYLVYDDGEDSSVYYYWDIYESNRKYFHSLKLYSYEKFVNKFKQNVKDEDIEDETK